jgi:GNAT superfamily N-acetyltransferase
MMDKNRILDSIYNYIAGEMNCTTEDLQRNGIVFIKDSSKEEPYVKILSINDTDIITTSEGMFNLVSGELDGRIRDELYECNYVFGQTLHYIPDLREMTSVQYPGEFKFELLVDEEVHKLAGLEGFENSLAFDENGYTPTCIVLYAREGDRIIGLAGASYENDELREVGVDVLKEYRGKGLASLLVRNLTVEILKREKISFYSASVTNIASQAVAIRSGYMPLWTDSFGTRKIL